VDPDPNPLVSVFWDFCGTGTGTVTNYGSGTGTRYKIKYFDYLHLNFFPLTFYNKFVEINKLFPCKTAYYIKRQKNFKNILKKFVFYGLNMKLEPEHWLIPNLGYAEVKSQSSQM
jgi:hypothetical protein